MGFLTTYAQNKILNHLFTGVAYNTPATLYFGLAISVNAAGTVSSEPSTSATGYSRRTLAAGVGIFGTSTTGTITNGNAAITFDESLQSWQNGNVLGYWFIADASTAGNVLAYGSIDNGAAPEGVAVTAAGQIVSFPTSQLTLNATGW